MTDWQTVWRGNPPASDHQPDPVEIAAGMTALEAAKDTLQTDLAGAQSTLSAAEADISVLQAEISAIGDLEALTFKGGWDASSGSYPTPAVEGDTWEVTTAGTTDSIDFQVGEQIIYTSEGDWFRRVVAASSTLVDEATSAHFAAVRSAEAACLGYSEDLGTPASTGEYVYHRVLPSGSVQFVRGHALKAGTLRVRRYTKSGSTYSAQESFEVTITGAGAFEFSPADFGSFDLQAGDYIGFTINDTGFLSVRVETSEVELSRNATVGATTIAESAVSNIVYSVEIGIPVIDLTEEQYVAAVDAGHKLAGTYGTWTKHIGLTGVPVSGLNAAGSSIYMFRDAADRSATLTTLDCYAGSAGTITVRVFSNDGAGTYTLERSTEVAVSSGLNEGVAVGLAIAQGEHVSVTGSATGVLQSLAVTDARPGFHTMGSLGGGNYQVAGTTTVAQIQVRLNLTDDTLALPSADLTGEVRVRNSERIALFGSSYSAGAYQQAGKAWVCKLSNWIDYQVENFAISGGTFASQIEELRLGKSRYGFFPPQQMGATYGWVMLGRNDAVATPLTDTIEDARQMIQALRGMGMTPVISTEWLRVYGTHGSLLMRQIAEQEGALFANVLPNALQAKDWDESIYAGFFAGAAQHPGVRTNDILANPAITYVQTALPRPRQSMKIWRQRAGVGASGAADLLFDGPFDRMRLFREIETGHVALQVADEGYYDTLQNPDPVTGDYDYDLTVQSDYQRLMAGYHIECDDYTLIEVVLPMLQKDVQRLRLTLSDPGVTVWARDARAAAASDGEAVGSWLELSGSGGVWDIPRRLVQHLVWGDRVTLLVYKSSAYTLAEPVLEWTGTPGKPTVPVEAVSHVRQARGAALIAQTDLGTLTGWTAVGSAATGAPADGMLPKGATGRVVVNTTDKLRRAISYDVGDELDREIEIRIWARRFPAIFDVAGDYATAPITQDSFDYAWVYCDLITSDPYTFTLRGHVGLWWKEIVLRAMVPAGTTGMDVQVHAASDVEVARVHCEFVE